MRTLSKRLAGFVGLGVVTSLAVAAVAYAAVTFGPSRPTFTYNHPATYITFNSITDNPVWGDERYLVKSRDVNAGTNTYTTNQNVSDNQELLVAVYFHNNAAANLNLVAHNTRVKIDLPSGNASSHEAKATISADNATPGSVFSTMDFHSGSPFSLAYVPGSAQLKTNKVTTALSDNVVNGGTLVGTNGPNGDVPGCSEFSGYVTIRVKVHKAPVTTPKAKINIRKIAEDATGKELSAVPTNVFTFKVTCDGKTETVTYNSTPQAAGECTVGSTVTVTENAVNGWISLSPATQSFTVPENGLTVVFKNRQKPVATPAVTPAPTTPSELPNTGAGSAIAVFTGVSALAGAGHFMLRKFYS